jgi:predicted TIM-barrel fold metal-dependent hydrolase
VPYIQDRIVHDADAHLFEPPGWFEPWIEESLKEALAGLTRPRDDRVTQFIEKARSGYADPEYLARNEAEITLRKGFSALGAFEKAERSEAIDHLGVASQLVFTTAGLGPLAVSDLQADPVVAGGVARAHNRAMMDFCSADARMLPALYVPFCDMDLADEVAAEAIEMGGAALMIPSACPKHHSPSHVGFDRVWARAEEAGVPMVFHVGGGTRMNPTYKENGLPPVKDFVGGDDNFTSVSYLSIPEAPMQTLATLLIDGVLERFPNLKFGVIEMGAGLRLTHSARTRSGCRSFRFHPRSSFADRCGSHPIPMSPRAGSSETADRRSACSAPIIRTPKVAATRSSASRRASMGRIAATWNGRGSTARTLRT